MKKKSLVNSKIIVIGVFVIVLALIIAGSVYIITENNKTGNEGILIETPVGELSFPEEVSDKAQLKVTSKANPYSATMYGIVDSGKYELFTIYIGESEAGHLLGTIKADNGYVSDVRIDICDVADIESLSQDERDELSSMQERVNDLIEQLYSTEGFESVNNNEH